MAQTNHLHIFKKRRNRSVVAKDWIKARQSPAGKTVNLSTNSMYRTYDKWYHSVSSKKLGHPCPQDTALHRTRDLPPRPVPCSVFTSRWQISHFSGISNFPKVSTPAQASSIQLLT